MFAKWSEMFYLVDANYFPPLFLCHKSYSSFKKIKQMWINDNEIQIPFLLTVDSFPLVFLLRSSHYKFLAGGLLKIIQAL